MTVRDCKIILSFQDIEKLEIISYFQSINKENFDKTASLFTKEGELLAPFEKPIIGRQAIASYLKKEARKMELLPQKGIINEIDSNHQQIDITGKVKTSLFTVNVGWYFTLDREQKIITAKIKLLASNQELLSLKKLAKK